MEQNIPDIFELDIPNEIYIVGAAPSVIEEIKTIPQDAYIIVCNAAILLDIHKNLWFVFDERVKKREWWGKTALAPPCPRVFGKGIDWGCQPEYTFTWLPKLWHDPALELIPNVLRGGATIGGCALQFCIQKSVKKIHLIGFSMQEPEGFDGHIAPERQKIEESEWCQLSYFKKLIDKYGENVIWKK